MAINIPITSSFDDKGLGKAQKALGAFGVDANKGFSGLTKSTLIATAAIGAAVGAVGAFAYKAIQAASDFDEAINKNKVVFGAISKEVEAFARTANTALGLSETAALKAAGTFAIFGKSAGLAGKNLSDFSIDLVTLASDLASFNNTSVDDAITALGSALRGEAEPLRKYGVLLDDATLKAAATELGIYSGSKALTAQQKVLAAQKVIFDQTGDAQGDFGRTSDGLAAQQKILGATFDDIQQKLGKAFLPIFLKVVTYLNDNVVPVFERVAEVIGEKGLVAGLQQALYEMGSSGIGLINGFKAISVNAARAANVMYKFAKVSAASAMALINPVKAIKMLGDSFNDFIDVDKLEASFDTFIAGIGNMASYSGYSSFAAKQLAENAKSAAEMAKLLGENTDDTPGGAASKIDKLAKAAKKAADTLKKEMAEAVKDASDALNKQMADALDNAKSRLESAQEAFNSFSGSVQNVITESLNFGKAFEEGGEDAGLTFFSALQKQADKAKEFADLVEKLLAAGLSREALQQVIDAGVESGASIAKELLQSSANVLRANDLVAQTNAIAKTIGDLSASKFYAAGVSNAQQYLAGVEAAMAVAQSKLEGTGLTLADVKGISAGFNDAISPIQTAMPVIATPQMPPIGAPTDKGQPQQGGPGGVTINVNSQLATKAEIGEAVLNGLIAYNRLSGPLQLEIA
ncbi:hypothetical protein UFOVP979_11 [uncultured Caudovirales phage]|uniref:Uncharacterized protein n=3 Tax=uncultured Caudovirales phage TaxID=2100421 RepID=A0A6J5Q324_9CAUD|nr:hypothetical protein UFOVP979_11 [uncultured Caudovirales phage]CAB4217026.1 hypothetical protein UFOVP1503_4 [uncultured Caudovirales phage]